MSEVENVEVVEQEVTIDSLLSNEKTAKLVQSYADSISGKAVDSYRDKGFKTAVEKAVEDRIKALETKTPEQIKIDELASKLSAYEAKIQEKELFEMKTSNKEAARGKFKEAGLPDTLIDFFVDADSEKTNTNISKAIEALTGFKTSISQELLGSNNTQVPGKTVLNTQLNTGQAPDGLSKAEYIAWFKKNRK